MVSCVELRWWMQKRVMRWNESGGAWQLLGFQKQMSESAKVEGEAFESGSRTTTRVLKNAVVKYNLISMLESFNLISPSLSKREEHLRHLSAIEVLRYRNLIQQREVLESTNLLHSSAECGLSPFLKLVVLFLIVVFGILFLDIFRVTLALALTRTARAVVGLLNDFGRRDTRARRYTQRYRVP